MKFIWLFIFSPKIKFDDFLFLFCVPQKARYNEEPVHNIE